MARDEGTQDEGQSTEQETDEVIHSNGETNSRLERLEQNNQVLQLLADPEIRAVVEAKRAGKKVKVTEDAEAPQETEEVSLTEGLEESDPTRPTLEKIQKLVKGGMSAKDAEIEELKARLAQVEGFAGKQQEREIISQIEQAKSKYKDFSRYDKEILGLNQKHPGLNVDQLYVLAKQSKGQLKMVEQATAQEKPTHQPARSNREAKIVARPMGKKGFAELLRESLKEKDLSLDE